MCDFNNTYVVLQICYNIVGFYNMLKIYLFILQQIHFQQIFQK